MKEIIIQPMNHKTVAKVQKLETACFADPWSLKALLYELEDPDALYLTALDEDEVIGYVGVHHVLDEGHITNVAVAPDYRRNGIAKMLIGALIGWSYEHDLSFLTLEVRASNEAAKELYRGFGFQHVGVRKGYYKHPTEDALLMTLFLDQSRERM